MQNDKLNTEMKARNNMVNITDVNSSNMRDEII